jgi:hypothetical protein
VKPRSPRRHPLIGGALLLGATLAVAGELDGQAPTRRSAQSATRR